METIPVPLAEDAVCVGGSPPLWTPDILSLLDLTLNELSGLTSSAHSSIKAKATKVHV